MNDPLEETLDLAQAAMVAHFIDRVIPALYCRACGARDVYSCVCPKFDIPLRELDQ
jgi:hypothetical protein